MTAKLQSIAYAYAICEHHHVCDRLVQVLIQNQQVVYTHVVRVPELLVTAVHASRVLRAWEMPKSER